MMAPLLYRHLADTAFLLVGVHNSGFQSGVCGSQTSFGALQFPQSTLVRARGRMFLAEASCSMAA